MQTPFSWLPKGAERPIKVSVLDYTPCGSDELLHVRTESAVADGGEYFRHCQYRLTANLRAMATLAMPECRRMARRTKCFRHSASVRTADCAASTSRKRNSVLPCLLMCPSRCFPALES